MINSFRRQYEEKIISAEKAAEMVESGDRIFYSEFAMFPKLLDAALAERTSELHNLELYSVFFTQVPKVIEADPKHEHIIAQDWHFGPVSRRLADEDKCFYVPISYHQGPRIIHKYIENDVAMVAVAPMVTFPHRFQYAGWIGSYSATFHGAVCCHGIWNRTIEREIDLEKS